MCCKSKEKKLIGFSIHFPMRLSQLSLKWSAYEQLDVCMYASMVVFHGFSRRRSSLDIVFYVIFLTFLLVSVHLHSQFCFEKKKPLVYMERSLRSVVTVWAWTVGMISILGEEVQENLTKRVFTTLCQYVFVALTQPRDLNNLRERNSSCISQLLLHNQSLHNLVS